MCTERMIFSARKPGEFIGGRVTAGLFHLADIAWLLFAVALVVTLVRRRAGAAIALAGCALWAPLILYVAAHDAWWTPKMFGLLALTGVTYLCLRGVRHSG